MTDAEYKDGDESVLYILDQYCRTTDKLVLVILQE